MKEKPTPRKGIIYWGLRSKVEHMLSIFKGLSSNPNTEKRGQRIDKEFKAVVILAGKKGSSYD